MLTTKEVPEGVVVTLEDTRVDMAVSRKFRDELAKVIEKKPDLLVLDLTDTEYFDSSALGTLVSILREAKSYGGQIRLANLNQTLRTLMKLSKLDAMFKIYESVDEALK